MYDPCTTLHSDLQNLGKLQKISQLSEKILRDGDNLKVHYDALFCFINTQISIFRCCTYIFLKY